ncbi:transcriptional repressor [Salirhabdus salicampi]|nr:transcriptional repressor [Salirhabdus salicampi]
MKDNGYKQTKQREKLLKLFQQKEEYMPVKEIFEQFQEDFPGASYNTIYRNLYALVDIGILESTQLNGEQHFRFHCDTVGHHHHFICTECGSTSPIDICPMEEVSGRLNGFEIQNHKFEVYGKCPSCH